MKCSWSSGTGKTLLARAVASQLDCNFLKVRLYRLKDFLSISIVIAYQWWHALHLPSLQVVSSSIVDKYIGESARLIREMFNYARDHQPCIIFMDEIDAIGTASVYKPVQWEYFKCGGVSRPWRLPLIASVMCVCRRSSFLWGDVCRPRDSEDTDGGEAHCRNTYSASSCFDISIIDSLVEPPQTALSCSHWCRKSLPWCRP